MISSERKHFNLRPARKHVVVLGLSNMVVVQDGETAQICHISFSESFVRAVGKVLPQGVSELYPAFVSVVAEKDGKTYKVVAQYLGDARQYTLWLSGQKPTWIAQCKPLPRNNNENHKTQGGGSASPGRARSSRGRH